MCPVCGNKTRLKIREDTELKKFPLYCPKCRQENLIGVPSAYEEFVSIRNRFKNFAVILYI
ncbi:TPA: cysteine-rich KTR domain-containing protein [Streptococcus pneumoniae]